MNNYEKGNSNYYINMFIFVIRHSGFCKNASIKLVEKTIQEAQEINANSFMGMEYLEFAGLSEERAKYFNDDMPGSKVTDDGYVRGYYFKIPKDASDRRLTQINSVEQNKRDIKE